MLLVFLINDERLYCILYMYARICKMSIVRSEDQTLSNICYLINEIAKPHQPTFQTFSSVVRKALNINLVRLVLSSNFLVYARTYNDIEEPSVLKLCSDQESRFAKDSVHIIYGK